MRLARRALFAALAMLMLCAAASAQTLRPADDPRNLSPAVGTGGPVAGPTGLFTIYDGQTLRRGEFTFSFAFSDYHRDPGNVHFQDIPASFNVGLTDHLEFFFNTQAYRGIKVDNPQNLSSFYLPNSQLRFSAGQLGSGAAIILAPSGPNVGSLAGAGAVFRPAFNQPFVQFPFVGGSAGTFGVGPGAAGTLFGFPGFSANLGPAVVTGGTGFSRRNFGGAANFPGIGSVFGSILPGIVLATSTLPATALTLPITVPVTFTTAPTYLPDAPFINRLYGESSFGSFVAGAKIRFTGPHNPFGFGIMPFYRFYKNRGANDLSDFNNLQRGASPGGNLGDFGLTIFLDGRLTKHANLSVNGTYIINSNPKSNALGGGNVTLLDRPNEFITGVGFDFPINPHLQPIAELLTTQYVGSRTPNAFENSPVDFVGGAKIYPRRWLGIGLAYRRHINYQRRFNTTSFNQGVNQLSGVNVPGRGVVVVPGTSVAVTSGGLPLGFIPSDDPNGFIGQVWFGHRNARAPTVLPNQPPVISSFTASATTISVPATCTPPAIPDPACTPTSPSQVTLTTSASDPDGDTLLYTYSTTGGRVTGTGPTVTWDLSGVSAGTYTATVEVDDGCGCVAFSSTTVTVNACGCIAPPCPNIKVSCPDTVQVGAPITFTATVEGGAAVTPTYNWSVSAGTITSGQGTPSITVDSTGLGGQTVTATVELGGLDPSCGKTASCSTAVTPGAAVPRLIDEYGNIRFNDEKARLDNYAIELQNNPTATGEILAYGACNGEGQARADRAKNYLVTTRGIDAARITTVDGGCRAALTVQLWLVPQGATAPAADTAQAVSPCPECRRRPARRAGRRRAGTHRRRGRGDDDEE